MLGAASTVLATVDHSALLKDAVTTPAGCTIDGIFELEECGVRVTLIKTVVKATERAAELMFVASNRCGCVHDCRFDLRVVSCPCCLLVGRP